MNHTYSYNIRENYLQSKQHRGLEDPAPGALRSWRDEQSVKENQKVPLEMGALKKKKKIKYLRLLEITFCSEL